MLYSKRGCKMSEVYQQICLWEKYLHQLKLVKIRVKEADNELNSCKILKPNELTVRICRLQKLIVEQEKTLAVIEKAIPTSDILYQGQKCISREKMEGEFEILLTTVRKQEDQLKSLLKSLTELQDFTESYEKVEIVTSMLSTMELELIDPGKCKDLKEKIQEIEANIQKLKTFSTSLDEEEQQIKKVSELLFCPTYNCEINTQRDLAAACIDQLFQNSLLCSKALNKNTYEKRLGIVSKWSELMPRKIDKYYHQPPEGVLKMMEICIKEDIIEKQAHLESFVSSVQLLVDNGESSEISEELSNIKQAVGTISSLYNTREQHLFRIISQKERVILLRKQLKEILKSGQTLKGLSEDSTEDVDVSIQEIHALQENIGNQLQNLASLKSDTEEICEEPDSFVFIRQRLLFKSLTDNILNDYEFINTLLSNRHSHLSELKETWNNLLILLENLEMWLNSREKIASDIDYISSDLSRSAYLEGIKTFENLKHNYQDDVHILNNVNTAYHQISTKDLDSGSHLQSRVSSLNDRWHGLYKKVVSVISVISGMLELWHEYEQVHQHLHLFLTETHIKITGLETEEGLNRGECDSIADDFVQHETVLERYYSMAKDLKEKSKCSSEEIESQVKEIQSYWLEVYQCLQKYKETLSSTLNIKQEQLEPVFNASLEEINVESSSKQSLIDDASMHDPSENIGEQKENVQENITENVQVREQTISDIETSTEVDSVQLEFVKDLLAALKEAEERIESLETVLSEPTPSGIEEESGPNYSRLLAACRSSIDVIQHLNQLLSENTFHQRFRFKEEEIQSRTEGLLNQWEKLENATLNKEFRAHENMKKWQRFTKELTDIEGWLLQTLHSQSSPSEVDADFEKVIKLLKKHETLVKEINEQKMSIITLNADGQMFISGNKKSLRAVNKKLQDVNGHWDKLCSLALEWQNKLQNDFLQSQELHNTISEMELWLQESQDRINSITLPEDCSNSLLHKHHTEIFTLKQQVDNCSQRVKALLDMSALVFHEQPETKEGVSEVQSKLHSILDTGNSLLLDCTEKLKLLPKLFTSRKALQEATDASNSDIQNAEAGPTRIKKCCNFLLRVARASFPIQAMLLLVLGAAILLPKEEEEISCRLSNNFASSLNPMLRYPDGPPPV